MTTVRIEGDYPFAGEYELLDSGKPTLREISDMQKVTGLVLPEIEKQIAKADVAARQALIWISLRRHHPDLRYTDLDVIELRHLTFHDDKDVDDLDPTEPGDRAD